MLKAKELIPELREEFWENVTVPGMSGEFNQSLERANRVADFLEFAELLVEDALETGRILWLPFQCGFSNRRA